MSGFAPREFEDVLAAVFVNFRMCWFRIRIVLFSVKCQRIALVLIDNSVVLNGDVLIQSRVLTIDNKGVETLIPGEDPKGTLFVKNLINHTRASLGPRSKTSHVILI